MFCANRFLVQSVGRWLLDRAPRIKARPPTYVREQEEEVIDGIREHDYEMLCSLEGPERALCNPCPTEEAIEWASHLLRVPEASVHLLMQATAFFPAEVSSLMHHLPRPFIKLFIRELGCVSDWREREPVLRSLLHSITPQLAQWGLDECTDVPGAFALLWGLVHPGPVEFLSDDDPWAVWQYFARAESLPSQQWEAAVALRREALDRCIDAAIALHGWLVPDETADEPQDDDTVVPPATPDGGIAVLA